MDSEKFKNLSAGVQSIVFSVGLVCAGIWGLYEFNITKYESIDLQLTASQIKKSNGKKPIISVTITLQNDGNLPVTLPLGERSVIATKIEFEQSGNLKKTGETNATSLYSFVKNESLEISGKIVVSPNSNRKLDFLLQVNEPGMYLIELKSYDERRKLFLTAGTYINVE